MEGGAITNPIIRPIVPVAKNNIISTLTLVGSMYLNKSTKRGHYYKLTVNQLFSLYLFIKITFLISCQKHMNTELSQR